MIGKFIASLSDLGKILFVAAALAASIFLFDQFLFRPTLSRMSTIDQEITAEKEIIKQDLHFLNYKDKILKQSKFFDPYLATKPLAEAEIIEGFLKKIDILKNKANVTISKVTPSTGAEEKGAVKYQADLECSGKLADVVTFMHLFNASDELMKVVKFNFSSKKTDVDEIKASITVAKLVVGKNAASIQLKQSPAATTASAQ